jgi:hypothetical protein
MVNLTIISFRYSTTVSEGVVISICPPPTPESSVKEV